MDSIGCSIFHWTFWNILKTIVVGMCITVPIKHCTMAENKGDIDCKVGLIWLTICLLQETEQIL